MASRRRRRDSPAAEETQANPQEAATAADAKLHALLTKSKERSSWNAALLWGALLLLLAHASWFVYYFQYLKLPRPVPASEAGKRGFSEQRAYEHVRFLTKLGPHPVGSRALEKALQYVLSNVEEFQAEAPWDVDVEVDFFHAKPGVTSLVGGIFKGRSLVYTNLKHVVVRVKSASVAGVEKNSILVSSHIDTVISAPGAGDCNSNIGVMLELVRAVSHWAHGFKHSVIFLFNIGEEEGLDGAHGFITQHPWNSSIRTFIDLEAIGVGGKSALFQGGPDKWVVELYAKAAKHPSAQIASQDLFHSGFVKSATDFQVYKEVANLSGLDVAFVQNAAVYHTKNDKLELLTPGSLQHIGDNVLAFLLEAATFTDLDLSSRSNGLTSKMEIVYFDILGKYFITYTQSFAKQLYVSVIVQTLLLLLMSLFQGGLTSVKAFLLSVRCIVFSWVCAIVLSYLVGVGLSSLSTATVPYIAHPWLIIGLYGSPALVGSLLGQYLGYRSLKDYLFRNRKKRSTQVLIMNSTAETQLTANERDLILATWDAERWLFKAGIIQWLAILTLGVSFDVGASYMALVWIVSPAVAYGLIDATFSPRRTPGELRTITVLAALAVPLIISGGVVIQLFQFLIGSLIRFDSNPGKAPVWFANSVVAVLVAITVCLFFVYLLPYAYRSGGFKWILCGLFFVHIVAVLIVAFEIVPPFTEHCSRGLNVVQVVEVGTGVNVQSPTTSYVSISSVTPGTLHREFSFVEDEGFHCGKLDSIDMVTFKIKYGCTGFMNQAGDEPYWSEFPTLKVSEEETAKGEGRMSILLDTKMARRWVLALNTTDLKSFQLEAINRTTGEKEMLASMRGATSVDGWHTIQFITDQDGPSSFKLSLIFTNSMPTRMEGSDMEENLILKLRTDVNQVTPSLERTLQKLPDWVTIFGKSTAPYPLVYLVKLPRTV